MGTRSATPARRPTYAGHRRQPADAPSEPSGTRWARSRLEPHHDTGPVLRHLEPALHRPCWWRWTALVGHAGRDQHRRVLPAHHQLQHAQARRARSSAPGWPGRSRSPSAAATSGATSASAATRCARCCARSSWPSPPAPSRRPSPSAPAWSRCACSATPDRRRRAAWLVRFGARKTPAPPAARRPQRAPGHRGRQRVRRRRPGRRARPGAALRACRSSGSACPRPTSPARTTPA